MNDYVKAMGRQVGEWPGFGFLSGTAVMVSLSTGWTLISGRSNGHPWLVLAFFVGSSACVTLCVVLIRLDVRRMREERERRPPPDA